MSNNIVREKHIRVKSNDMLESDSKIAKITYHFQNHLKNVINHLKSILIVWKMFKKYEIKHWIDFKWLTECFGVILITWYI